jgi:tRNA pseudouridine38-40 synthase
MISSEWQYKTNCNVPASCQLPRGLKRVAAILSYNGKDFCGFQKQNHSPSLQEQIEKAFSYVANQKIIVSCAGRTDTGVHATHQVIHFDTSADRTEENWLKGVNRELPDSISLIWINKVSPHFHSRFSAISRSYRYIILIQRLKPVMLNHELYWRDKPLLLDEMQRACGHLLGEQDFSAFRASGCQSHSAYRNVKSANIMQLNSFIIFDITANAFLLHMVRNIMGALISVGEGKNNSMWMKLLLRSKDRTLGPATAAPNGLYLVNVEYPERYQIPDLEKGPLFIESEIYDR